MASVRRKNGKMHRISRLPMASHFPLRSSITTFSSASNRPAKADSLSIFICRALIRSFTRFSASAKLGERVLEGGKWKDWTADWPWWEIDGWWANVSRPTDFSKTQFLPREGLEFQIDRRRFTGNRWRMMFDIGGEPPVIFPANADNLKTDTWLQLDLGR